MHNNVPPISDWQKAVHIFCFVVLVLFLSCWFRQTTLAARLLDLKHPRGPSSNQEDTSVANDLVPGVAWNHLRLESFSEGRSWAFTPGGLRILLGFGLHSLCKRCGSTLEPEGYSARIMSSSIQGSSLCNYSDPKILKNDINIGMAPAILHLIVSDSQVGNWRAEVVMCILMQQRIITEVS